jgi:excisionase family DNA binding protein
MGMPTLYALLSSGELRGLQLGGRMWRVSEQDLTAYLDAAYQETSERIAAGDIGEIQADGDG